MFYHRRTCSHRCWCVWTIHYLFSCWNWAVAVHAVAVLFLIVVRSLILLDEEIGLMLNSFLKLLMEDHTVFSHKDICLILNIRADKTTAYHILQRNMSVGCISRRFCDFHFLAVWEFCIMWDTYLPFLFELCVLCQWLSLPDWNYTSYMYGGQYYTQILARKMRLFLWCFWKFT